jgi:hypothetical protein
MASRTNPRARTAVGICRRFGMPKARPMRYPRRPEAIERRLMTKGTTMSACRLVPSPFSLPLRRPAPYLRVPAGAPPGSFPASCAARRALVGCSRRQLLVPFPCHVAMVVMIGERPSFFNAHPHRRCEGPQTSCTPAEKVGVSGDGLAEATDRGGEEGQGGGTTSRCSLLRAFTPTTRVSSAAGARARVAFRQEQKQGTDKISVTSGHVHFFRVKRQPTQHVNRAEPGRQYRLGVAAQSLG